MCFCFILSIVVFIHHILNALGGGIFERRLIYACSRKRGIHRDVSIFGMEIVQDAPDMVFGERGE
jgi:hypothetical protein